ncbi:MAG: hypothetical protein ACRED9_07430 [Caulobacteraceae bacterium]
MVEARGDAPEVWEFASHGWLLALERKIDDLLTAAASQANWSFCEVFTDVPAHLACGKGSRIAWACRIVDGKARFAEGECDEVDLKTTGDYAYLLPLSRWRIDEKTRSALGAYLDAGVREGKITRIGDPSAMPPELATLHNAVVDFTR